MRRTKATLIYKRTKNLRAVQLLLGHSKLESTVRYLGIEVDEALEIRNKPRSDLCSRCRCRQSDASIPMTMSALLGPGSAIGAGPDRELSASSLPFRSGSPQDSELSAICRNAFSKISGA